MERAVLVQTSNEQYYFGYVVMWQDTIIKLKDAIEVIVPKSKHVSASGLATSIILPNDFSLSDSIDIDLYNAICVIKVSEKAKFKFSRKNSY